MAFYNAHETPRKSALHGVELATFTRRALAFLADIAIASASFAIFTSILEPLFIKQGWIKSGDEIIFAFNLNWYSVVWTVLYFSLATYLGNGKTPGKWIVGIRTLSLVHTKMSLWHSVERALGYGASLLECGFGFFQYFIHPNRRTVHDRIAETIVVRDIRQEEPTQMISSDINQRKDEN